MARNFMTLEKLKMRFLAKGEEGAQPIKPDTMQKITDKIDENIDSTLDNIATLGNIQKELNGTNNSFYIGRFTKNLSLLVSQETVLKPERANVKNMSVENGIITINESGFYYINCFIHLLQTKGATRSFVNVVVENGGSLCPAGLRSNDSQALSASGDPAYELNSLVYLEKGAKLTFSIFVSADTVLKGNEENDVDSSRITVFKIRN